MYRICKEFEIQAAHVLSKHPGPCRFPHGHTYRIEVTVASDELDENDMVCDFGALRAVVEAYLSSLDHVIMINSADEETLRTQSGNPRKVVFDGRDPSSEVLAFEIFAHTQKHFHQGEVVTSEGVTFKLNPKARIEKVRVWESMTAWAEYQE